VSDADIAALMKELPEPIRPVVRFCYITGWRLKSEVLSLRWAQVSSDAIRLEPGTTKSGEGREWPLTAHPELARLIEQQRTYTCEVERGKGQIVPWVFHREGRPIRNMKGAWARACERAGLKLIPHDLRRSAVRNLERAGVPRSVAMKLVGHKTEAIYRRYAIVAPQDLAEGVAKLAALHGAEPKRASSSVLPLKAAEA
jgi:integrase